LVYFLFHKVMYGNISISHILTLFPGSPLVPFAATLYPVLPRYYQLLSRSRLALLEIFRLLMSIGFRYVLAYQIALLPVLHGLRFGLYNFHLNPYSKSMNCICWTFCRISPIAVKLCSGDAPAGLYPRYIKETDVEL